MYSPSEPAPQKILILEDQKTGSITQLDTSQNKHTIGNNNTHKLDFGEEYSIGLETSEFKGSIRYTDDIGWIIRQQNYSATEKEKFLRNGGFVKMSEKDTEPEFKLYVGMIFILNGHAFEVVSIS